MRVPRVRFTVRRMMAAVAIVALLISAAITWQRRVHYQSVAREFARREQFARRMTVLYPKSPGMIIREMDRSGVEVGVMDSRKATYYTRMRERYERAARRPWTIVGPDPFEPE